MTHDELLARLSGPLPITMTLVGQNKVTDALRAIVELHKPDKDNQCEECSIMIRCEDCAKWVHNNIDYPCFTIKVIESELA